MIHLDLFSGIGGFALACQWAGIETIGFVEIGKYCQKVLRKHWPGVPIVEDIRDVETIKEVVADSQIWQDNKRDSRGMAEAQRYGEGGNSTFGISNHHGTTTATIDRAAILVTAGFPCQPFSVAGKRGSTEDDRYLWPETLAVIKAVKPEWVLLENVTGIINLALDTVLSDLEGAGYSYETLIIPACAVNAWHRRDRIWIIANKFGKGLEKWQEQNLLGQCETIERDSLIADSRSSESGELSGEQRQENTEIGCSDWWAVEPELGRVAHGIPRRVDRLKCLGNAIVPQVAYEIIKVIADIEDGCLSRA